VPGRRDDELRWEERLLGELDDLEQQAEGLHLAEREAAVSELSHSTYAEVELAARLHASTGAQVQLSLTGGATVEGTVLRVGRDWVLVGHPTQAQGEVLVRTAAVLRIRGASERALPEEVRSLDARLGWGSVLRQLAAEREHVSATIVDASVVVGRVRRVGADFLELVGAAGRCELVPFASVALVRRTL
jgi:hypothetical protein